MNVDVDEFFKKGMDAQRAVDLLIPPRTPNRGRQPRCQCGLIATFPEHDHEIKKLKSTLAESMRRRDELTSQLAHLNILIGKLRLQLACPHLDWGYDQSGEAFCHDCSRVVPMASVPKRLAP